VSYTGTGGNVPQEQTVIMQDAFGRSIPEAPEGALSVRIMGPEGDVRVAYEPASQEQVDAVVRRILDHKKKGYGVFAFAAGSGVKEGTMLSAKDINAGIVEYERVVLAPPMAGG
jgi:hypothetical protein